MMWIVFKRLWMVQHETFSISETETLGYMARELCISLHFTLKKVICRKQYDNHWKAAVITLLKLLEFSVRMKYVQLSISQVLMLLLFNETDWLTDRQTEWLTN
jgi:hypothetical protein